MLPTGLARTTLDTLGQWIVNGRLPPGEVMPTEPELAASLGVSRTTVRDAVKVLSGKGLVRTARRYGTRITPVSSWNLLDADVIAWHASGPPEDAAHLRRNHRAPQHRRAGGGRACRDTAPPRSRAA